LDPSINRLADTSRFSDEPETQGVGIEQVQAIIDHFRTQRISVAALLARARLWRLEDDTLTIAFADDFGAAALSPDRDAIQAAALEHLQRTTLSVRISTLEDLPQEEADTVNGEAEMVRKVFRGEIVEGQS
jgi:hypothetical protein